MPQSKILLGIFLIAIFHLSAIEGTTYDTDADGIMYLNDQNFDQALLEHEHLLVFFYSKACGSCKKFHPSFVRAVQRLAEETDRKFPVAKVEVRENTLVKKRFSVMRVPTLYFFHNGEATLYTGPRSKSRLVQYYLNITGPLFKEVTCDQLSVETKLKPFAAAFFGELNDNLEMITQLTNNAKLVDQYAFYNVNDKECSSKYGAESPALVLFRKFDEQPVAYAGEWQYELIEKWMALESKPKVIPISEEYVDQVYEPRSASLILFISEEDKDKKFREVFYDAASQMRGEILFVTSGMTEGEGRKLADIFGVVDFQEPSVKLLEPDMQKNKKYDYPGSLEEMTVDSLRQFVKDYQDKQLPLFYKSEKVMSWDDSMVVKPVVSKNFQEKVLDHDKEVFIHFSGPDKRGVNVTKEFYTLAEELKDVEGLIFLTMNGLNNEVEGLDINKEFLPMIYLYPSVEKNAPKPYGKQIKIKLFKQWLGQNSDAYRRHLAKKPSKLDLEEAPAAAPAPAAEADVEAKVEL